MLSTRTGLVKVPPSPLISTDRCTKVSNLRMGARGAKMRWETIVEAHGGRIEAESQPGEGTRMSFILPLLQERGKE
jgi:signal transduction histidine kinase